MEIESNKIIQIIPDLGMGGAEIMVENLTNSLIAAGFCVEIICFYRNDTSIARRLENNGIQIYYLNKMKGLDLRVIYSLFKILRKHKPQIIHTHLYTLPYTILPMILLGIKVRVHTIHNIATKEVSKFKRKINYLIFKFFKVTPVSISHRVQETVMNEYAFTTYQTPIVYNGIDINKCLPKTSYNFSDDHIVLLHIGRFTEQKNHSCLIECFAELVKEYPKIKLELIGAGELQDQIIELAHKLQVDNKIEFLGMQSNVYSFLNKADIFILPSLWEGMPITLIEALATGIPIVATNVGGVPDMIQNNYNGLLVEPDKDTILCAIRKLLSNTKLREFYGINALKSSTKYKADIMANEYIKIYRRNNSHSDV